MPWNDILTTDTMKKVPSILVALQLAYQNGRDCYTGILQYLATERRHWNICLVRGALTSAILKREVCNDINGVIMECATGEATMSGLGALGVPCAVLDAEHPAAFDGFGRVAFVNIDSAEIGRRGADYLDTQGNYASFGILGYETDCNWSERRIDSFSRTLEEKGRECSVLKVRRASLSSQSFVNSVQKWARGLRRPAAVMAVCDELARAFVSAIEECGIRIPHDVAVLGVDNEWIICTHTRPTLSSIRPDFERSGYVAAQSLDRLMSSPKEMRIVETSPVKSVVGRESTAPSNATGIMVLRAENFILDHDDEAINVGAVANHLKVSRRLLDLRFREVTGRTVLDAIRERQMENVRRLLRQTTLSITEISAFCGFRSENHMKKLFKSMYGQTMSAYRTTASTIR